jgi:putative DNA primase/helicase
VKYTDPNIRPHVKPPVFTDMPPELMELAQWVLWKFVWARKKWEKVPYNARTRRPAKTNDSSTWASFDIARTTFERRKNEFDGIGFVFTAEDEFCGIDFDNCVQDGQTTNSVVSEWLEKLDSYTELSVSGSGFHAIVRGVCGDGLKKGDFEIYDRGRYFTFSGRVVKKREIQFRQPEIDEFKRTLKPETKSLSKPAAGSSVLTLSTVLKRAFAGKNGIALRALYEGSLNGHKSHSEAVASLCWKLAFWTNRDPALLDAAIRGSRLFDSKWDSPRGNETWGSREIANAIDNCPEFFDWCEDLGRSDGTIPSLFTSFSEFMEQEFNDADEIAFHGCAGEVVLVQSVTNHGKSTLIRNSGFCLASGKEFSMAVGVVKSRPRKVVLLNLEGAAGRFQSDLRTMSQLLSQAELELVKQNLVPVHAPLIGDEPLSLSRHITLFEMDVRVVKPEVIIIDTASAAFTIRNENDNSEVAELMKRLVSLARKLNCVIVLAHHIGKAKIEGGQTREAAHRGRGASAWADAAAAVFNVEVDPNDKNRITVTCAKRKSGADYETIFKLDRETRWLTPTDETSPKPITSKSRILKLLETSGVTQMKTSAIEKAMAGALSRSTVMSRLKELVKDGSLTQSKRGWWSLKVDESEVCPGRPGPIK